MIETIGGLLDPYKNTIELLTVSVTTLQFFSGSFVIKDIWKKGNTDGLSAFPFLAGAVFCILNLQFGQMIQDDSTIKVNFLGLGLNVIYIVCFYMMTPGPRKIKIWAQIGGSGIFASSILAYVQYEDPKLVEFRFGIILTLVLFALVGMPLMELGDVIKSQSAENLPFPIIFAGSIVSVSWLLYGFILRNYFIVFQSIVTTLLGSVQLSLFVIYPGKAVDKAKKSD